MAYRFKDWDTTYENDRSRAINALSYYCQPNKLVGEGIGMMLMEADGLELYGVLGFLKALASTAPREWRGWLVRNGSVMDARRMSALTHIPMEKIERALRFFSTAPMDWLVLEVWPPLPKRRGGVNATGAGREQDGSILTGLSTDKGLSTDDQQQSNKQNGRFASAEAAAEAQKRQFGAVKSRIEDLERVSEDDRTPEQEAELKKMRGVLKAIQKKQRAGDFTPVEEKK